MNNVIFSPGRIQAEGNVSLRMQLKHLKRHFAVAGGTGMGKTFLMLLIFIQWISQGLGGTFITPHPDAIRFLLDWLALNDVDPNRVIHIKPTADLCVSIDPFADQPQGVNSIKYDTWLCGKIDQLFAAFVRNCSAAEQEMMKRLRRWFNCAAYLCGLDRGGMHVGLAKLPALLKPTHPEFDALVDGAKPFIRSEIGREVILDFEDLRNTPGARQREQWTESVQNLKNFVFGPIFRQIVGMHAKSLNQRDVIMGDMIQLVDVSKCQEGLSREQGRVTAGFLINQLSNVADTLAGELPEDDLHYHLLQIDEFEHFIGEETRADFGEKRKARLIHGVGFQDKSCLKKGDLDLYNKVVSQVGWLATFQQQSPEDIEEIGKAFAYPSLNMTPQYVEHALPDGHEEVPTESISITENHGTTTSWSESATDTSSSTLTRQTSQSINEQVGICLSSSETRGRSRSRGEGDSVSFSESEGWKRDEARSHSDSTGESKGTSNQHTTSKGDTHSSNESRGGSGSSSIGREGFIQSRQSGDSYNRGAGQARTEGQSDSQSQTKSETTNSTDGRTVTNGENWSQGRTDSFSRSRSAAVSTATSKGVALNFAHGQATSEGKTEGWSEGTSLGQTNGGAENEGWSVGRTYGHQLLQKTRIVRLRNGLEVPVPEQIAAVMQILSSLPEQMVLVKVQGMPQPFVLRVHDLKDPYLQKGLVRCAGDRAFREEFRRKYLERVYAAHPFYFVPRDEEDDRCRCGEDACACEPTAVHEENLFA